MGNEIWKPVKGYEDYYEISNMGRVKSLKRTFRSGQDYRVEQTYHERILKNQVYQNTGYVYAVLTVNSKNKKVKVHRLVAEAFVDNSEGKPQIDHINTVRSDNRASNLRWVTQTENQNNPLTKLRHSESKLGMLNPMKAARKKLAQIDPITNKIIKVWLGVKDTARELGYQSSSICRCCSGQYPMAYGFIWKYVD